MKTFRIQVGDFVRCRSFGRPITAKILNYDTRNKAEGPAFVCMQVPPRFDYQADMRTNAEYLYQITTHIKRDGRWWRVGRGVVGTKLLLIQKFQDTQIPLPT